MNRFKSNWPALVAIIFLSMAIAFFGCPSPSATPTPASVASPSPEISPTASPVSSPTPTPGVPTITITKPTANSTVPPGNVTVSVQVSNFQLVDKVGQSPVPGQGHINYFLDFPPPTTPGQPANGTANVSWVATANTTYTFANVTAGNHTAYVELVNNDNTPLVPPALANVTFIAGNVTPSPTPTPTATPSPSPAATAAPVISPSPSPTGTGKSATIDLIAHNIAFNLSKITVPAGAAVTINFHNEDTGIPHNFALFKTSAAQDNLFTGKIITGVSSTTYQFTAPSTPGDYFFRCDVHPTIMTGTFVVTPDP